MAAKLYIYIYTHPYYELLAFTTLTMKQKIYIKIIWSKVTNRLRSYLEKGFENTQKLFDLQHVFGQQAHAWCAISAASLTR